MDLGDILWVVTVPAIWSSSAKQLMKRGDLASFGFKECSCMAHAEVQRCKTAVFRPSVST